MAYITGTYKAKAKFSGKFAPAASVKYEKSFANGKASFVLEAGAMFAKGIDLKVNIDKVGLANLDIKYNANSGKSWIAELDKKKDKLREKTLIMPLVLLGLKINL